MLAITLPDGVIGAILGGLCVVVAALIAARANLGGKRIDEGMEIRTGYRADIASQKADLQVVRLALDAKALEYAHLLIDFERAVKERQVETDKLTLLRTQHPELFVEAVPLPPVSVKV